MGFQGHDKFTHNGGPWVAGEFNDQVNGHEGFVSILFSASEKQNYGLKPVVDQESRRITDVELVANPPIEGLSIESLAPFLREKFAETLQWSANRAKLQVDEEVLTAVKEGRNLKAEQETQADFDRLTRNLDHDLEAAYMLRDSLREEVNTALDEGRDTEAKAAMEQLGEVKKSIAGYWNPHKERPPIERKLNPAQEEEVELMRMMLDSDLEQDAAKLAASHFEQEAQQADKRGDKPAAQEAAEKAKGYAAQLRSSNESQGQSFAERHQQRQQQNQNGMQR